MRRAIPLLLLACSAALGCGPEFEDQSKLTSLRVLGVRKDKPYAKPGDTVKLTMLYDDAVAAGADAGAPRREVNVMWIARCENPRGDSYLGCVEILASSLQGGSGADSGTAGFDYGPGHAEFSFKLSSDIVAKHGRPPDKSPPYGLAYVFFLVCAGDIRPAPAGQQFPLACYSKGGEQLGAEHFVVGYTAVYAYETITNANPTVLGFSVDDKEITPLCIDEACVAGTPPSGGASDASTDGSTEAGSDGGHREGAAPSPEGGAALPDLNPCDDPEHPACFEVCEKEKQADCPEHEVKLLTNATSVEDDLLTKAREGRDIKEQAWINYYADRGKFVNDLKLLGDATEGYQEEHGTKFRVPKELGPFNIWAVAHDNRGGVGWVQARLATRKK